MSMGNILYDEILGELHWSKEYWQGVATLAGRQLPLTIEFDAVEVTSEERHRAIASAREVYPHLDAAWEQQARLDAAIKVTEATYCQSDYVPTDEDLQELLEDMVLESLDLTYSEDYAAVFPYLAYTSPKCYPSMRICIQFSTDLAVEEVTING